MYQNLIFGLFNILGIFLILMEYIMVSSYSFMFFYWHWPQLPLLIGHIHTFLCEMPVQVVCSCGNCLTVSHQFIRIVYTFKYNFFVISIYLLFIKTHVNIINIHNIVFLVCSFPILYLLSSFWWIKHFW